jgi:hypothetical protein
MRKVRIRHVELQHVSISRAFLLEAMDSLYAMSDQAGEQDGYECRLKSSKPHDGAELSNWQRSRLCHLCESTAGKLNSVCRGRAEAGKEGKKK